MTPRFQDKVVLVTGAAGRIGSRHSAAFAAAGAACCNPPDSGDACDADAVVHVVTPGGPAPTQEPPAAETAEETPAPPELPFTGASPAAPVQAGLVLLLCGAVLVYASRLRFTRLSMHGLGWRRPSRGPRHRRRRR